MFQTDLYVFRGSNGQLVTSHRGIDTATTPWSYMQDGEFIDDDTFNQGDEFAESLISKGAFNFAFMMRGPDDYWDAFNVANTYKGWASQTKMAEPFQRLDADHLRPGEKLKLIVINRATGYIGSTEFTYTSAASGGDITNALGTIEMYPPNLKIWAERVHEIKQGKQSSQDKTETNIIGNEGISLEDDLAVTIHTEWLDHDGRPLPIELDDFGYTARLAKVTRAPTPDEDVLKQNSTYEFPIKTGRNLNVFKFNQKALSRHHYYVQVNPYPADRQNDFGSDEDSIYHPKHQHYIPAERYDLFQNQDDLTLKSWSQEIEGLSDLPDLIDLHDLPDLESTDEDGNPITATHALRYRPAHYVPFKVPLFDEQYTQIQQDLYDDALEDNPNLEIKEPEPLYRWYYRPELQFSQYDFDAKSLIVKQMDENNNETISSIDITEDGADFGPVFDQYTDSVELLFDLLGPELEALPALETEREFVLSLGGEEVLATIGQDGKVVFENPDHLNQLSEEDLLSLRLYLNGDRANVLWEYQFWALNASVGNDDVLQGNDIYYVNADDPNLDLVANFIGYGLLSEEEKAEAPQTIHWRVTSGNAQIYPQSVNINKNGAVQTKIRLTPNSHNIAHVEAYVLDSDGGATKPATIKIGVIPGKPDKIEVATTGNTYLKGKGQVELEAIVKDQNNNLVTNGTGVLLREHGHVNVTKTTGITDNGKVRATLTGGSVAGSYAVDVYSGEAFTTTNVSVSPLTVEIESIPDSIQAGETLSLTAKVSGGSGNSLNGIFLDIGTDGGMINQRDLVTNAQGELKFQYQAPLQAGNFQLGIKLDLNVPEIVDLNVVTRNTPQPIIAERTYLVAGSASQNGSVTNYQNETATITYPEETVLNLKGTAGENWTLALNDPHLPNVEPVYFTRFNELFKDATRTFSSFSENVSKSSSAYAGLYALKQDPGTVTTPWQLNNASEFVITQPSYNLWLNLAAEGDVLTVANGSITLAYNAGQLIATAQSTNGEGEKQTTTASIPAITTNQWYAVAIAVQNGQLTLRVNEQQNTAALAGNNISYNSVSGDSPWLSFSNAFSGKAAGLRIYDLDSAPLLELASSSGTFDPSGNATANIQLTNAAKNNALTQTSVTVGIQNTGIQNTGIQNSADGADYTTLNILSDDAINDMANVLHSVTSSSSLHSDAIVQVMPLNLYFPDPKSSASQYVAGFALQSNNDASLQNVLANLAWLKLENKYPVLHDDVATLQQYFADQQHADLTHYMAEYIQEATVQASNGNNFWLRAMATSFKVWAELAAHNPQEAGQIAAAIQNRTDFWAWVRILSIPANGWATDSVPLPRPDITCDKVAATVNVGTPLEFSPEPCRASGTQIAALINTVNAIDPAVLEQKELLTTYVSYLLASVKEMPMEYKQWFTADSSNLASNISPAIIPYAHAAAPAIAYPVRAFLVLLKQAMRKGAGGAPANFIAFMQGGTTSRVKAAEFLPALAYLASRFEDASDEVCDENCIPLRKQVSDTVKEDMATWFVSMGLSKNGLIEEENTKDQSCSIARANHGKAFELLGTAMYHALFEFGDQLGIDNEQYEILLSDPRKDENIIKVGLMEEHPTDKKLVLHSERQRKPDLVLQGEEDGETTWIEFKSWGYYPKTFAKAKSWNGESSSDSAQYTNASRQYFLDVAASQDVLFEKYWDKQAQNIKDVKPANHMTWFHVWEGGSRRWPALVKEGDKYKFATKYTYRSVSRPWINSDSLIKNTDLGKDDEPFHKMQEFLSGVSPDLKPNMYEATIGKEKSEHEKNFVKPQVATTFSGLLGSNIRPFNIPTFLALELGDETGEQGKEMLNKLMTEIGGGQFVELQKAINNKEITTEQVEALRDNLTDEMEKILGPWAALLIDIPLLSTVEDKFADWLVGDEVESIRKALVDYEIPEDYFENLCEDQ